MHTLNKSAYILALCLSALAGCVDVIGFMQLGGYFISFMSGNSTQLSIGLVTSDTFRPGLLAGIIGCFVVGTLLGTLVRHFSINRDPVVKVLAFVTALLTASAISNELGGGLATIALMALAMGAENAVFQRNGDVVIGLTYMTGTLVKVGQRLANALVGGPKFAWFPFLVLWLSLMTGGIIGALLFNTFGLHSLWAAALWAACITIAAKLTAHNIG